MLLYPFSIQFQNLYDYIECNTLVMFVIVSTINRNLFLCDLYNLICGLHQFQEVFWLHTTISEPGVILISFKRMGFLFLLHWLGDLQGKLQSFLVHKGQNFELDVRTRTCLQQHRVYSPAVLSPLFIHHWEGWEHPYPPLNTQQSHKVGGHMWAI